MKKKIVYIAHPIGGNVHNNIKSVLEIYRMLSIENEVIPFAPYLTAVQALDDLNPEERSIGFSHNEALFNSGVIDEVWLYGNAISKGMLQEVNWAKSLGIAVISMSEGTNI